MSPLVACFAPTHKMLCEDAARPKQKQAKRARQPLPREEQAYRGEMSCTALLSAIDDTRLSPTERVVFGVICKGYQTRASIAQAAGCAQSSVPRAVRKLEATGYLKRQFSDGKPNQYRVFARPDTGIPQDTGIPTGEGSEDTGITSDTGVHVSTDTPLPVDKSSAHIRHARARGLDNPSKDIPRQESYPASVESLGALTLTAPDEPKPKRKRAGQFKPEWTLGEKGRAFAREQGFLNGSADALFERFKDHHTAKGSLMCDWEAAWRTWVRNELKFNANRRPHDQPASASDANIRRDKVSLATAARERDRQRLESEALDRAIDLGRVASVRID